MGARVRSRISTGVVLVCVCALALVAIPAGGAGAAQSAQGSSPTLTIPVGMTIPVDSPAISFPSYLAAMKASIKGFNKRNPNAKLVLTFCDGKSDVNTEADCARQLVAKGVAATVGDINAVNQAGVNQIFEDAGIPRIGLTLTALDEFQSPVSYPLSAGPILPAIGVAPLFQAQGIKKISVFRPDNPQGSALVDVFMKAPMAKYGIEIVDDVSIPTDTTDYSSYVTAAQANGAEAIDGVTPPQTGLPFATAAQQLGTTLPLFLPAFGYSLKEILDTGYTKWSLVDSFPTPEAVNVKAFPNLKLFLADMKAAKNKDLAPDRLTGGMEQGWLALQAIEVVTKGMTSVTAASMKAALDSAKDIDMLGIIPPWTPSNPGPSPLFSRVSNPYLYRIKFAGKKLVTSNKNVIDVTDVLG